MKRSKGKIDGEVTIDVRSTNRFVMMVHDEGYLCYGVPFFKLRSSYDSDFQISAPICQTREAT